MKKVICLIMCVVMMLSTSVTAFAAYESWGFGDIPYSGAGESEVKYTEYSRCLFSIPEVIEIQSGMAIPIEITSASFIEGECLQVNVLNLNEQGYLELKSEDEKVVYIELRRADLTYVTSSDNHLARIYDTDIDEGIGDASTHFTGRQVGAVPNAGYYSGTMRYEVMILPQE